jgi:ABC-type Na+ efflux pump permease subunit
MVMSPSKTWAVFVKESRHIVRDPGTLILLLLAPVILMIIFSYALVADIRETPIIVIDSSQSALSRQFLATLATSNDIIIDGQVTNHAEAEQYFDRNQTKGLVVIPPDFGDQLAAGKPVEVQILVDGTDPTTAHHVINHTVSRSRAFGLQVAMKHASRIMPFDRSGATTTEAQAPGQVDLRTRTWYNPDLKNTHGIVPAMIPIVLSLPAIVVMNAIVREKENGTLEGIFATPLGRSELLIGKLIPYVVAGVVSSFTCALVAVNLFGVPFRGTMSLFLLLSTDFLLAAFGLGLFLAIFLSSQAASSVIGLLVFLFPSFFLSGIFYPIASFPDLVKEEAQWLPSTHFVAITRGLMVKGQGLEALLEPALMLLILAVMMTILAVFFFKKRLR